jgi:CTP synthase (UTP-ammonia lyase)
MALHPFFITTLFLPQLNSKLELPNSLITAFVEAAARFQLPRSAVS